MALLVENELVKKTYIQCDKCKKKLSYEKTLTDGLMVYVQKKWKSVEGVKDGWLCPECVAAIINEWYSVNEPGALEMPLFSKSDNAPSDAGFSEEAGDDFDDYTLPEPEDFENAVEREAYNEITSALKSGDDIPF